MVAAIDGEPNHISLQSSHMAWHGMSHLPNFTVFIYTTHPAFWSPPTHPTSRPSSPSSSILCVSVDCSLGHRRNLRKEIANLIPYKCPRLGMEGPRRSPSMACSAHRTTHARSSHHFCATYKCTYFFLSINEPDLFSFCHPVQANGLHEKVLSLFFFN